MATSTRQAIRAEAAARSGPFLAGTATSGSTTTLVDTARLLDAGRSTDEYVGHWIYFTSNGSSGSLATNQDANVRRVQTDTPSTGTLTQGGTAWATAPNTNTYELHGLLDPRDWNTCITRGLRRCFRERQEEITIVASQQQYSLASYTWFERRNQLLRLRLRKGATANQYEWEDIAPHNYEILEDDDGFTLSFRAHYGLTPASNLALFFSAIGPYADLTSDSATTTCPLDYITAATVMMAYELFGKNIATSARGDVAADKKDAINEYLKLSRRYAPRISRPVALDPF